MARKINKKCCVCGNEYTYCPSCGEDRDKPTWMNSFCSENCKQIYEATAGYFGKAYSAQEAKTLVLLSILPNVSSNINFIFFTFFTVLPNEIFILDLSILFLLSP